jgi:hypothetical protein
MPRPRRGSLKTAVIALLYEKWRRGEFADDVIRRADISKAMEEIGSTLSVGNLANFLKDLIRNNTIVENWPPELVQKRISARQRYGEERVFQFFEHPPEWETPFPDWHAPNDETPIYTIQSLSIDSVARNLGRDEETWLTQIAVNLHLVQTQLSIFSPAAMRGRIRDVRHLQMSIKTQPEIDAAFVATYHEDELPNSLQTVFVTLEAKRRNERILLDQIREQVAKAFEITNHLEDPPVDAVKPMALQVVRWPYQNRHEKMIFLVEFEHMERARFDSDFDPVRYPLAIHEMHLEQVSCALYRAEPAIPPLGRTR